ncbi:MAG TPA: allantoinase PuuE [Candidatus Acidoferrales bacterium]|nr:allantoinase PuuE [Candidatus Acidoferrales bacterium]
MSEPYPRDVVGYGAAVPHAKWPAQARIAVQFVLNYEEGGEACVLHGDAGSEVFLSEIIGAQSFPMRHMSMESLYEYGSRAGFWRLLAEFQRRNVPLTVFGVAMALARNPQAVAAMVAGGHEIASHGWRWISYQNVDETTEREHIALAVQTITALTGSAPLGWYTGRDSPNTRRLVVEHGGFLYDADSYADDLPYWVDVAGRPHLVVPYTLDTNDMRFATAQGFNTGEQFYRYLCDAFDVLYREGEHAPKMLSIGLHCRLVGRPGRFGALQRFLDYVAGHDRVWLCRRVDIARHWYRTHPPALPAINMMERDAFTAVFAGIFEHSPWVAQRTWEQRPFAGVEQLHAAMLTVVRDASPPERLALIRAHPELAAGRAKHAELTVDSQNEQASAGLDRCSESELALFARLNAAYRERFGFPFVLAVKGLHRQEILENLRQRLEGDREEEFARCLTEIGKIAQFRLASLVH